MAKILTAVAVGKAKPKTNRKTSELERHEIPDRGCKGLYLIVQPSGAKSWAVRYRYGGRTRKLTLGALPALQLSEARVKAAAALAEVAKGTDPIVSNKAAKQAAKQAAKRAAIERSGDTVERLTALFLEQHAKTKTRRSSWSAVEGTFRREVLPRWRGRMVADITRKDVRELIREIAQTRPIQANRAQTQLSRFFRWLVNEDYITGSPVVGLERPAKENVRERSLSDDEVRRFWSATEALPAAYRDIYRLLLLSGARRQEVAGMEWRELDMSNKVWTLPSARSKSKFPHMLPLGPLAWSIIEAQPKVSVHVFGRLRSGFSSPNVKPRLDEVMQPDAAFVTHDLRRTARSLMSRAKIDSVIAERMIGHLPSGMIKRYDRHDFLEEKHKGFVKLESEVELILNPPQADVVPLRPR
jgi:integrase